MRRKASNGVRSEPLELGYVGGRMASATTGGKARLAFGYDEQGNVSAVSAYDASGAAIERTVCLVHDALGRLVAAGYAALGTGGADVLVCRSEAELAEVIARFRYDAWNRRVARQEGSGAWTVWAYDGEGRPLSEVAPSGTSWTAGRDYVFLERQPLAQVEYPGPAGGEGYRYYLHTDHLGLPRAMTSGSGQVVWSAAAVPNGELQETVTPDAASGRTVVTNLRLPGQYDERLLGSLHRVPGALGGDQMVSFLASLATSRRFGKATRLQERGAYDQALVLLLKNRTKLASANVNDVQVLSVRLMNLVHLAEVAKELQRPDLMKDALQEWMSTWETARQSTPALAGVEPLTKWERWVRAMLAASE